MQSSRDQFEAKGKEKAIHEEPSSSEESSDEESGSEESEEEAETAQIFALDHCRQHGTRFAFQIAYAEVERYSIRLGTTESGRSTCSCAGGGNCRHIQWFLNQLSRTGAYSMGGGRTSVTPYDHISQIGLGNLCEDLQWELREGMDSDTEETQWQLKKVLSPPKPRRLVGGLVKEKMDAVRDIMATFSDVDTDHFREDIFDSSHDVTMEPILVRRDLEATIARVLIMDDNIFRQFNTLISHNVRAAAYFEKMGIKAKNVLGLLDEYCEVGPVSGKHDLIWSAQTLVDIVDEISMNVTIRQPLDVASRSEAAKSLVSILSMVVRERNHDCYQQSTWPRCRPHGEQSIDRNLYERLIGSTSRSNPAGGTFVIKALQDLPEAQHFVEVLEEILALLETIGWGPAPQSYRDKLSGLIAQLKGGSVGKRSAGPVDRKVKRMK
ncbi:SWIM zinc finger family protein [Drepanopeziza brunnea f. sp. 'multigermtubi' MB_m1]|uniref:SWIM zinc finger family protein n=2 Tax=Drepanopeziza brunnea f. sp. 'multigermtubi' TaxID=698441 RepID=K1WNG3_MARBU|nr:SWIM zinc finger family protein [Drepanopeziza brunnea f. sp. 'multigermtubi' MB_m1]EKD19180.1 SWIM zinc finger family protein [Drepanopeziza brunnea f. sp. 'multigermtubi' MB_m1]